MVKMQCCDGNSSRVGQGMGSTTDISLNDGFIEFRIIARVGDQFIILSMPMDNFSPGVIDQKTRCLAAQKVKARIIKDSFIREGAIDSQQKLAFQVVRYSTLLSEKMLDKIKTEELRNFQKRVQEYCKNYVKMKEEKKGSRASVPAVSVSQYLTDIKRSTKMRLLNSKKRTQTFQNSELSIIGGRESPAKQPQQNKTQIPLGNQKIKEAMQSTKHRSQVNKFHVNGKGVNSQIINLLEKLQELESFEKLRRRREMSNEEEEEYLHGRTNMLKKEQERLSTAFETQERCKFKPIGRVRKEPKMTYERSNVKLDQSDALKKLHNRANRAFALQPIKRSQIVLSSNFIGQASLHLQEGLPQSIRNKVPNKKMKRSQGYIPYIDERPEQFSLDKQTPDLQSKDMFLLSNFSDL